MGCNCGGKKQNVDYEVTFKDGSKMIVKDLPAVRMAMANDQSKGRPSPSYKAVPRL